MQNQVELAGENFKVAEIVHFIRACEIHHASSQDIVRSAFLATAVLSPATMGSLDWDQFTLQCLRAGRIMFWKTKAVADSPSVMISPENMTSGHLCNCVNMVRRDVMAARPSCGINWPQVMAEEKPRLATAMAIMLYWIVFERGVKWLDVTDTRYFGKATPTKPVPAPEVDNRNVNQIPFGGVGSLFPSPITTNAARAANEAILRGIGIPSDAVNEQSDANWHAAIAGNVPNRPPARIFPWAGNEKRPRTNDIVAISVGFQYMLDLLEEFPNDISWTNFDDIGAWAMGWRKEEFTRYMTDQNRRYSWLLESGDGISPVEMPLNRQREALAAVCQQYTRGNTPWHTNVREASWSMNLGVVIFIRNLILHDRTSYSPIQAAMRDPTAPKEHLYSDRPIRYAPRGPRLINGWAAPQQRNHRNRRDIE